MKLLAYALVLIVLEANQSEGQRTALDSFENIFRITKEIFSNSNSRTMNETLRMNLKLGKLQKQFRPTDRFFCNVNGPGARSKVPPKSVHRLRPGDIDIVAAMGDSLTAGIGALATSFEHLIQEYKGISWSIGGQGTWRQFLTLPNILKEFNPKLYGYSLSSGTSTQKSSKFNVAELGAMSRDTPHMAKILIKRMRADPRVDIKNHWKLITFMIGPNDFCVDMCYQKNPEKIVDNHERDLLQVFRMIRDNLPRTMLNVVLPPSVSILNDFRGTPNECLTTHVIECPCFRASRFAADRKKYVKIIEAWKKRVVDVANREEFETRPDFAINVQTFLDKLKFPVFKNGVTDFRYMALDCFHMSQRGYAIAANALWNNLLEPYSKKSRNWKKEFTEFRCPTISNQYLTTKFNSH